MITRMVLVDLPKFKRDGCFAKFTPLYNIYYGV